MTQGEGPLEKIQAGVVAIIMGYFLLKFFDAFPTGNIADGPFSGAYLIISLIPWLLVVLGIVLFLTMFAEVLDF